MLEVQKDFPIPARTRGGKMPTTKMTFPWEKMEVGDSFFVSAEGHDHLRLMNKITASGRTFFGAGCVSARCVVEDEFGIRVWRIQ